MEHPVKGMFTLSYKWDWCLDANSKNIEFHVQELVVNGLNVKIEVIGALLGPKRREVLDIINFMGKFKLTSPVIEKICTLYLERDAEACWSLLRQYARNTPKQVTLYRGAGDKIEPVTDKYALIDKDNICVLTLNRWDSDNKALLQKLSQIELPLNVYRLPENSYLDVSASDVERICNLPPLKLQVAGQLFFRLASIARRISRKRRQAISNEIVAYGNSPTLNVAEADVAKRRQHEQALATIREGPVRVDDGYLVGAGRSNAYYVDSNQTVFNLNVDETKLKSVVYAALRNNKAPIPLAPVKETFVIDAVRKQVREAKRRETKDKR
jgi:hypothetical protein